MWPEGITLSATESERQRGPRITTHPFTEQSVLPLADTWRMSLQQETNFFCLVCLGFFFCFFRLLKELSLCLSNCCLAVFSIKLCSTDVAVTHTSTISQMVSHLPGQDANSAFFSCPGQATVVDSALFRVVLCRA